MWRFLAHRAGNICRRISGLGCGRSKPVMYLHSGVIHGAVDKELAPALSDTPLHDLPLAVDVTHLHLSMRDHNITGHELSNNRLKHAYKVMLILWMHGNSIIVVAAAAPHAKAGHRAAAWPSESRCCQEVSQMLCCTSCCHLLATKSNDSSIMHMSTGSWQMTSTVPVSSLGAALRTLL